MNFSTIAEDMHAAAAENTDENGSPLPTDAEWVDMMKDAKRGYDARPRLTIADDKCEHREHEHGICIECGADCMDSLIGRAEYFADCAADR